MAFCIYLVLRRRMLLGAPFFIMSARKVGACVNILFELVKENVKAVVPIALIVILLNYTLVPLGLPIDLRFLAGAVLIIIGLSLFLLGVEIGITPMGSLTGSSWLRRTSSSLFFWQGWSLVFHLNCRSPA